MPRLSSQFQKNRPSPVKLAGRKLPLTGARHVQKGDKVVINGRLHRSEYQTTDGLVRQAVDINANSLGLIHGEAEQSSYERWNEAGVTATCEPTVQCDCQAGRV